MKIKRKQQTTVCHWLAVAVIIIIIIVKNIVITVLDVVSMVVKM